jgi:hypothetical protein
MTTVVCSASSPCGSSGAIIADTTSFALTNVAIGLPALVVSCVASLVALGLVLWVTRQPRGSKQMIAISDAIQVCVVCVVWV